MAKLFLLVTLLVIIAGVNSARIFPNVKNLKQGDTLGDPFPQSLYLITTARSGKSFFTDHTVLLNWWDAKTFCEENGMRLAMVTTEEEGQDLTDAYHPQLFSDFYWTAGRDSQELRQFSWDYDEAEVTTMVVATRFNGIQSCLILDSLSGERFTTHFDINSCTQPNKPMCMLE